MKNLFVFLLICLFVGACREDEFDGCFQCTTEFYEDGELVTIAGKSNLYCDMDLETAYYFERVNSLDYMQDGVNVKIETRCSKLLR